MKAAIAWPVFETAMPSEGNEKLTNIVSLLFKMSTINRQSWKYKLNPENSIKNLPPLIHKYILRYQV